MSGHTPGRRVKIPIHSAGKARELADISPNREREVVVTITADSGS
jgi:hypothetical protein